jgi:phenylpyruvate tautomerase PptA (4-oxalocrotonate tautomerase family)
VRCGLRAKGNINVNVIESVFDAAQKRTIVEKLTDAMVAIEGENAVRDAVRR